MLAGAHALQGRIIHCLFLASPGSWQSRCSLACRLKSLPVSSHSHLLLVSLASSHQDTNYIGLQPHLPQNGFMLSTSSSILFPNKVHVLSYRGMISTLEYGMTTSRFITTCDCKIIYVYKMCLWFWLPTNFDSFSSKQLSQSMSRLHSLGEKGIPLH